MFYLWNTVLNVADIVGHDEFLTVLPHFVSIHCNAPKKSLQPWECLSLLWSYTMYWHYIAPSGWKKTVSSWFSACSFLFMVRKEMSNVIIAAQFWNSNNRPNHSSSAVLFIRFHQYLHLSMLETTRKLFSLWICVTSCETNLLQSD